MGRSNGGVAIAKNLLDEYSHFHVLAAWFIYLFLTKIGRAEMLGKTWLIIIFMINLFIILMAREKTY